MSVRSRAGFRRLFSTPTSAANAPPVCRDAPGMFGGIERDPLNTFYRRVDRRPAPGAAPGHAIWNSACKPRDTSHARSGIDAKHAVPPLLETAKFTGRRLASAALDTRQWANHAAISIISNAIRANLTACLKKIKPSAAACCALSGTRDRPPVTPTSQLARERGLGGS